MTRAARPSLASLASSQKKMLFALACAVGMRMLGLFLVLPVFTLYGLEFTRSHLLVGIAFGAYGVAVALSAMPMGRLSDRIGRRKVLILGMVIFGLGSALCAIPQLLPEGWRIGELVFGRFVQGLGTITAAAFATVADQIPLEHRSTAMAVLGIPIGLAFGVGVIAGPFIAAAVDAAGLFWLTAAFAFLTVGLLVTSLPDVPPRSEVVSPVWTVLRNRNVIALDAGGLLMNAFMTAFWFYLPLILTRQHHLKIGKFYEVLLPMLLISGVTMFGFSRSADRGLSRPAAAVGFLLMAAGGVLLFRPGDAGLSPGHLMAVIVPGTFFFAGFTGLEPVLPSLVSQHAHETAYGTALGSFQMLQYFGSFAGATVAGALSRGAGMAPMYFMAGLGLVGFLLIIFGLGK
jgi:MFS family permease